jgi:gliding motility-associated-like protein
MRIAVLLALLLCGGLAQAQSADKQIAYFSFDQCDVRDDSGNGPAGALDGDITCVCGIGQQGYRLDQDDNAIVVIGPSSQVFTTSDFTVSFYIRPDGNQLQSSQQVIMYKQDSCKSGRAFWVRFNGKSQVISSGISQNDTLKTVVQAKLDENPCWQLITLTRNNLAYSLYVNGTLRDTRNTPARLDLSNNSPLKIGMPLCPLDLGFLGVFDELRIFSKALAEPDLVKYNVRPDDIINSDTLIYKGNEFQIDQNANCSASFKWLPDLGVSDPLALLPIIRPEAPTTYTVQKSYDNNCIAIDTIRVDVIDPDTLDCEKLFLPSAFTPNSSVKLNDVFGISNYFVMDQFKSFEIFDRWGGRVFNAVSPQDAWDGRFGDDPVNPGVFLYRVQYTCNGKERVRSGTVTVLK